MSNIWLFYWPEGLMMEIHQLGYFVAVAEDANFTRAAKRMNVAQSGISQQIRRLERELGESLFDRSNHAVRLTAAGAALLPHARAVLNAVDGGKTAVGELRGLVRGRLLLGAIQGLPELNLAATLAAYHRSHPGVDVTLRENHPEPLIDELTRGNLDAAIIGLAEPQAPAGLSIALISAEPLVLVTAPDHPLAGRGSVAVAQLRDEPLVTLSRGAGLRRHIDTACARAGFSPRVAFETGDVRLLGELVAHGLGVTVVPRSIAALDANHRALRTVDLRPIAQRCVVLAWRTAGPLSPATRAFVRLARAQLRAQPGTS